MAKLGGELETAWSAEKASCWWQLSVVTVVVVAMAKPKVRAAWTRTRISDGPALR